eukprot:2472915-Amphidinium_carterae.2
MARRRRKAVAAFSHLSRVANAILLVHRRLQPRSSSVGAEGFNRCPSKPDLRSLACPFVGARVKVGFASGWAGRVIKAFQ